MSSKKPGYDDLELFGLTEDKYEECLKDIVDKQTGNNDMDWIEIVDKYDLNIHYDTLRKASSTIFGGAFVSEYYKNKSKTVDTQIEELEKKSELIKARQKLRTEQILLNKIYRENSRIELFYDNIKEAFERLPRPVFHDRSYEHVGGASDKEYVLTLADIHAGARFCSLNNEYSLGIMRDRFEKLCSDVINFVINHRLSRLKIIIMGDEIQGMLRLSDISLNETSVVESVVIVSKVIAEFLNNLSAYCDIECYYVPYSNHNQTRPIGTKANEMAREDMTFVIANYIQDVLRDNERVDIYYNNNFDFVEVNVFDFNIIAMHGHQVKDANNVISNLALTHRRVFDYVFLAHFHASKELVVGEGLNNDIEVIVVPSFIGSDPYSDKLMKGAKASAKIYGFDEVYGHTETYKFILN